MSYAIIKSIKIVDNKVFISASSNNVYPHQYSLEECKSLSEILQKEGKDAVQLEIFKQYENGCFQRGGAKYLRALKVLRHMPEYERFNWRTERNDEKREARVSPEFDALLTKALNTRLPKDKYVVSKDYFGRKVYAWRLTKHALSWTPDIKRAKVFRYENDARDLKANFSCSDEWLVESLKQQLVTA